MVVAAVDWDGVLTGGPDPADVLHRLEVEEVLEIVDDAGGRQCQRIYIIICIYIYRL